MKTTLPKQISTIEQAKAFLKELFDNGESFHPYDDPDDIDWGKLTEDIPDAYDRDKLGHLMYEVSHIEDFDPCEYLLELNRPFLDMNTSNQEKPSETITFENWLKKNGYIPFSDGRPRWSKGYASFGADELYDRFLDSENHPHHEGQ